MHALQRAEPLEGNQVPEVRLRKPPAQGEGAKRMTVEEQLKKIISRDNAAHLTLIDPDKQEPEESGEMAIQASDAGTDGIMVGGSTQATGELLDQTVAQIKEKVDLPVILFPASEAGVSRHADAIFFMSLLNSKDPRYITGAQVRGAPLVNKFGLESIPMAYLIVEPGGAAGKVGKAELIPRDDLDLAVAYALAAQYLGMRFVYLEAGSGAKEPVPSEMIEEVSNSTDVVLIVGGGIRKPETAANQVKAGAEIIVTGTIIEEATDITKKIKEIVGAIKASGGA